MYIKWFRGFFICTESAQNLFGQQPMQAFSRFRDLFGLCMNILIQRHADSGMACNVLKRFHICFLSRKIGQITVPKNMRCCTEQFGFLSNSAPCVAVSGHGTGVQTDRNSNIVPIKNQSPKQRIDGTAALLDCYVGPYEHYEEYTVAI